MESPNHFLNLIPSREPVSCSPRKGKIGYNNSLGWLRGRISIFESPAIKTFFIGLLTLLYAHVALSQQDPQFTQYMFNTAYYNPGNTGIGGQTRMVAMHRSQWIGYESSFGGGGAPSTQFFSMTTALEKIHSGMGIHVVNDNLGPQNNLEVQLAYAYHLNIKQSQLSFGVRAGMYSQSLNFDQYRAIDPDDPLLSAQGRQSQIRPDLTAGIFFQRKKYYAGISLTHLISSEFDFGVGQRNKLVSHIYANVGYFYDISLNLRLQLAGLVKSDLTKTIFDVSGLLYFKDILWGGLSFRQSEAIIMMLGYSFLKDRSLKLGYALDYIIEAQQAKQPTSHEFMIIYNLPIDLNSQKKIIRTPRFRH